MISAVEKARSRAASFGNSEPPSLKELSEELLMMSESESTARSLSAIEGVSRIWDTASKGMTRLEDAVSVKVVGPSTKVSPLATALSPASAGSESLC